MIVSIVPYMNRYIFLISIEFPQLHQYELYKSFEYEKLCHNHLRTQVHIPADTRSAFPVISVHSPVSIQCRWQS